MRYSEKVLRICRAARTSNAVTALYFPIAVTIAVTAALAGLSSAQSPSMPGTVQQVVLIPLPNLGISMRTLVERPPGAGPFPLVLINHASTESAERRASLPEPRYVALAQWFLQHGYLVAIPERPGHGGTGGPYLEDQGGCDDADYVRAGRGAAASIAAALAHLRKRQDVRRSGAILVGHSAGGWGVLALASEDPRGVAALINFAGGRGGRSFDHANNNCAPERLIAAVGQFGATARLPSLWIYGENDSYFAPWLARRMAEAWRTAGGNLELALLPRFGLEGHDLAQADDGAAAWGPVVSQFLAKVK